MGEVSDSIAAAERRRRWPGTGSLAEHIRQITRTEAIRGIAR
jgi:hypothetical protein